MTDTELTKLRRDGVKLVIIVPAIAPLGGLFAGINLPPEEGQENA
jgi:hypothetical protein